MCARPLRVQYSGAFYHVMNRGNAYRDIFKDEEDRKSFLDLLGESVDQWKMRIHAFCLMSNHYHMLIETPHANISRGMRHVNGVYTQRYNKKWKRDGHIFRGRYKAILVEDDAYLVELLRYIHLNPVEAGLVKGPEQYKWSSHSHYLGRGTLEWLTTDILLRYFGKQRSKAKRKLHEFVLEGVPEKLKTLLNRKKWPSVMGAEHFQEWVEWNFVKEKGDNEIQYEPLKQKVLKPEKLRRIMVDASGLQWGEIEKATGYEAKRIRKLAIRAFHRYTSCDRNEICELFGSIDPSSISRAVRGEGVIEDPLWKSILHQIHFALCKT